MAYIFYVYPLHINLIVTQLDVSTIKKFCNYYAKEINKNGRELWQDRSWCGLINSPIL